MLVIELDKVDLGFHNHYATTHIKLIRDFTTITPQEVMFKGLYDFRGEII